MSSSPGEAEAESGGPVNGKSAARMPSPARLLINPVTRCWAQPHGRYRRDRDGRGTNQTLDAKRLTLMHGRTSRRLTGGHRTALEPNWGTRCRGSVRDDRPLTVVGANRRPL